MKYVHTNIIAKDWKKLSEFYMNVFECEKIPPQKDLKGQWVEKLTGIKDAHIEGIQLTLPGYDEKGPTLEIFSYNKEKKSEASAINEYGIGHLAFLVDDVEQVLKKLIKEGGSMIGEIVEKKYDANKTLTVVYARDIEGNIVEIQNWKE